MKTRKWWSRRDLTQVKNQVKPYQIRRFALLIRKLFYLVHKCQIECYSRSYDLGFKINNQIK